MDEYKRGIDTFNRFMKTKSASRREGYTRPVGARQFLLDSHGGSMRTMIRDTICRFVLPAPISDGHVTCNEAVVEFERTFHGTIWFTARVSTTLTQPILFIVGFCTNVERRFGGVVGDLNLTHGQHSTGSEGKHRMYAGSDWLGRNFGAVRDHGVTFRLSSSLEFNPRALAEHWATTFPGRLGPQLDINDMQPYFTGSAQGDALIREGSSLGQPESSGTPDAPDPFPIRIIFE